MIEDEIADERNRSDDAERLDCGEEIHRRRRACSRHGKEWRQRDERDCCEILKQQHGEREPPVPRVEISRLLQDL